MIVGRAGHGIPNDITAVIDVDDSGANAGCAKWTGPAGAPPIKGQVQWTAPGANAQLMLLDGPLSGMLMLTACGMGEQVMVFMGFFVFGQDAKDAADSVAGPWQSWLQQRFA